MRAITAHHNLGVGSSLPVVPSQVSVSREHLAEEPVIMQMSQTLGWCHEMEPSPHGGAGSKKGGS
jgi:hypothetical protein